MTNTFRSGLRSTPEARIALKRFFLPLWLLTVSVAIPSVPSLQAAEPATVTSATQAQTVRAATPTLSAFVSRVELTRKNLPTITKTATVAAEHILTHPGALVDVPYFEQQTFAEEILNRAGGLSHALPTVERPKMATSNDITLLSVRSWEQDGEKIGKLMANARQKGWKVFLFASRAGMPAGLKPDYLIENGATSGSQNEAHINSLANVLNVWTWTSEYVAAMTRKGKYPGVLSSIIMEGSEAHNKKIQSPEGRPFQGVATTKIPAGELGNIYLRRVDSLLSTLRGDWTQMQINRAAELIATQLNEGKQVGVATCTHFLLSEIFLNTRTPMKPFNVVWHSKTAFKENLKEGETVLWIGYVGVSTQYEDYGGAIRDAKLKMIASFVPDADPANNGADAISFITQHWTPPDAEVPLPFPPGRMTPVSGLDQGLIYRMLEDAVLARLDASKKPA